MTPIKEWWEGFDGQLPCCTALRTVPNTQSHSMAFAIWKADTGSWSVTTTCTFSALSWPSWGMGRQYQRLDICATQNTTSGGFYDQTCSSVLC